MFCLLFFVGQVSFFLPDAHAVDAGGVVISQMYPGASGTGSHEFVELFNNSDEPVKVTDWCLKYTSLSDESPKNLGCFTPIDDSTELWLPANGYALFVSAELPISQETNVDGIFTGTIVASDRHIVLYDSTDNEVDRLGWGAAENPEGNAAENPANGKSLQRIAENFKYKDSNDNESDFTGSDPIIHASNIYEETIEVDVCTNIADVQTELPEGFLLDESNECQPDSCLNIDGLQISVPEGYDSDDAGTCVAHDECDNLPEAQTEIPEFMIRDGTNDCIIEYSPLELTEILPNAEGVDSGSEFVEIHNSGSTSIDLTFYLLKIGLGGEKIISFPIGTIISPGEYKSFSDSELKFTLVNSSSKVVLTAIGGKIFGDTGIYNNPKDGESWAYISGNWEYTNRPTPDLPNLASIMLAEEDDLSDSSGLKPCNSDQYRNPETNRCKKYETTSLKPCAAGQYRSPETNRCRNSTTAGTSLKPCDENQERNPETNRCRKVINDTVPDAGYAVEPIPDTPIVFAGWWALGGVGALAGSYGAWEWRRELKALWLKLFSAFKM